MGQSIMLSASVVVAGLVAAQPAIAQNEGANASDIVVTARRVEERLQDVPISITVLSQSELTNQNIVTASDLAIRTPSLSATNIIGGQNTTFAIRGFNQDIGSQPTVGVYFADVVAPRAFGTQRSIGDGAGAGAFFDLQNVQVLKGPQGTLFGRNTTGGAILLTPQKPTGDFEGFVEAGYGNYDMAQVRGVINVPLGDKARFRLAADRLKRDGYLRNTTGVGPDATNDADYYALRASLAVDLTDDLENYTIVNVSKSAPHGDLQKVFLAFPTGAAGLLLAPQLARSATAGHGFYTVQNPVENPISSVSQWQIINTTTVRLSDELTFKNIVSYGQLKEIQRSGIFGTYVDLRDFFATAPAGSFVPVTTTIASPFSAYQETITEEARIEGQALGGRLLYQTGGYFEQSSPLGTSHAYGQALLNCTFGVVSCNNPASVSGNGVGGLTDNISRIKFRSVGIYGQGSFRLTEQLAVTAGIRYTWDQTSGFGQIKSFRFPVGTTFHAPSSSGCVLPGLTFPCSATASKKSDAPTWLISLEYKPTEDILAYAKWSRGYRTGGIQLQVPASIGQFEPEKVEAYELGFKTSFRGAISGTFNVAGFYNDLQNQQISLSLTPTTPSLSARTALFNAGKSRIYGVEVSATLNPFEGMSLTGDYTYLNTELREVTIPTLPAGFPYVAAGGARVGDPLSLSPRNKFSLGANYTLPVDEKIGRISLGVSFNHTDKQNSGFSRRDAAGKVGGFIVLQPRDILDLNLSWMGIAGSPIDLSLFATNVTGQKYYTYVLDGGAFAAAQIGAPRMYGARIRYTFGK